MTAFCGDLFVGFDAANEVGATRHRRIETPAARRTDPESSHLAAEHITASGMRFSQQKQVADAVGRHRGHTSQELAELTGLDRYMLARRLPECETAGRVRKGPMRTCSVTGRKAHVWEVA